MLKTLLSLSVKIINVDLSHIENKVSELVKFDRNLVLIQGELIEKYGNTLLLF